MKKISFLFILAACILVACSGDSVANKMYEHLEKSVELEQPFAEQQESFADLEEKEQEVYNQIIELSSDQMDEITDLSEQAITNINERRELLKKEKESIDAGEKEFSKAKELVKDLEDDLQGTAEKMVKAMEERYASYGNLNKAYQSSLDEDQKLYELFTKEELTEEELRSQIDKVNQTYEEVIQLNETFNKQTDTYNELKKQFYEETEMNVVYE
ncbi:YkyA family protein [Gracilibacillus dipsosauri]|uniref:Cell-wall binding lipoprotein n=1 Tax=Gracilibacillus dipsosauri TaxID=178340 RepID=A0A317L1W1_9BACI|nr:YkyA family protein [Gracilibacillus dipsosauri]PWU69000.1 hypothetical protein DLJ74_11350 [Gracilibacillus dipsosauri]